MAWQLVCLVRGVWSKGQGCKYGWLKLVEGREGDCEARGWFDDAGDVGDGLIDHASGEAMGVAW